MDIPYKGYTIVPNSERQPDGRWLPVADLQADDRGVLTPRPPLRAEPREIRATRADADAVALKMAKAWIEEIERDGASRAPIEAASTPRISPEPSAQDARVKTAPRVKRIEVEKRAAPAPVETLSWPGLHEADRFTRLLAVHSLLDRLVTVALATRLAASGESIFDTMAALPFPSRVALASTLHVVPDAAAESILEMDRVRNRLVHSKSAPGKPAWDVGGAVESVPQDVLDRALRKGFEAAQGLIATLRAAAQG
ncbi:MAG TPA: hypothetical protein VMC04_20920 [Verrucomicrobiae bacterium]|jgi:hypothetical protein|nr:hypothetical protein [Verrucomicrobiae bacterium]